MLDKVFGMIKNDMYAIELHSSGRTLVGKVLETDDKIPSKSL